MTRTLRDEVAHESRCAELGDMPEVGQLVRNGRDVFYVYINGVRHERHSRLELGAMMAVMLDKSDYLAIGAAGYVQHSR